MLGQMRMSLLRVGKAQWMLSRLTSRGAVHRPFKDLSSPLTPAIIVRIKNSSFKKWRWQSEQQKNPDLLLIHNFLSGRHTIMQDYTCTATHTQTHTAVSAAILNK